MKSLNIIKTRKIWFVLSAGLVGGSILSLLFWGLNFGIDFTGGSLTDITITAPTSTEEVRTFVESYGLRDSSNRQ